MFGNNSRWPAALLREAIVRLDRLEGKIDRILRDDTALQNMQEKTMASLDDVLAEVTSESGKLDSLSTLIAGIQSQLQAALAGSGISAAAQAEINNIFAALQANTIKIDTALASNTPPSPSPTPPPQPAGSVTSA